MSAILFIKGGVPMALGMGFSFFESVTVTSLGGITGTIFFVFLSEKLIANYQKLKRKRIEKKEIAKPKKIFTRSNRLIIKTKKRFGLAGIAFLTPLLFSFPLGCFVAVRFFKEKQKIIMYMCASVMFWSVSGYFFYKPIYNLIMKYIGS
jgi:uncharacterized membrane protein